jgi:hypothetical protein
MARQHGQPAGKKHSHNNSTISRRTRDEEEEEEAQEKQNKERGERGKSKWKMQKRMRVWWYAKSKPDVMTPHNILFFTLCRWHEHQHARVQILEVGHTHKQRIENELKSRAHKHIRVQWQRTTGAASTAASGAALTTGALTSMTAAGTDIALTGPADGTATALTDFEAAVVVSAIPENRSIQKHDE